jgi:iron complex outermembrane receptor protein
VGAISVRGRWIFLGIALCCASIAHAQASLLDRKVSLSVFDISLREALDRLSAVARVRFSYTSDAIPLDRAVRTSGDSATVRQLLEQMLAGVAVVPVVAGVDQIVLTPAARGNSRDEQLSIAPTELSRVVVTGSTIESASRPLSVSLSVLGSEDISRFGTTSIAGLIDGNVPGLWVWDSTSLAGIARYASIRGASSLGTTYPKVYVDGIGVANPLLLTSINPETVDRIEIIRGPQGAALYGSDAISGVVNIVTRHDGPGTGARLRIRSTIGGSSSDFASAALAQNHSVTYAGGSPLQTGYVSVGFATLGDFYANTSSTRIVGDGGFRRVTGNSIITGTAQLSLSSAGVPMHLDTAVTGPGESAAPDLNDRSRLGSYTVGLTVKTSTGSRVTHTFTAGVDGYRLRNFANEFSPLPSSADSALRAAHGGADRTTARATTAMRFGNDQRVGATLSLALEHSALRQESPVLRATGLGMSAGNDADQTWVSDAGLVAQIDASVRRRFYVTGGVRFERNSGYVARAHTTALPMIGAAYVRELGAATLKWRAAFGRGVRAPRTAPRETMMGGVRQDVAPIDLEPERQSGIEGGFDLYVGRWMSLQLTAFNQTATGLIQQVMVPGAELVTPQPEDAPLLSFRYQNVGSISNRGLEAQARVRRGAFVWNAAFSTVATRVESVADAYTGDLREGDRVLGVPARTMSTSLTWAKGRWILSAGASRAFDWIEYDRVSLSDAYRISDRRSASLFGDDLRGYWREYNGQTRLRASVTRAVNPNLAILLQGENLAGYQSGEPDNATILPGRTITAGIRLSRF